MSRQPTTDVSWEVYRVDQGGNYLFTGMLLRASTHVEAHKRAAKLLGAFSLGDVKVCLATRLEDTDAEVASAASVRYKVAFEVVYTSTKPSLGDVRKETIRQNIEKRLYDAIDSEPFFQKDRIDYGKIEVRTMSPQGRKRNGE